MRDDSGIATAIAHVLENNAQLPEGRVHARVEARAARAAAAPGVVSAHSHLAVSP